MESAVQPVSFATLLNTGIFSPSPQKTHYSVDKYFLAERLEPYISNILFDERWYLTTYPDVAVAIARDRDINAHGHYVKFGYFENRVPYEIRIDENWYRTNYRDVEQAVTARKFPSAQDHFIRVGFLEGRLPYPGFELRTLATS